jgi:prephenate dehydratase
MKQPKVLSIAPHTKVAFQGELGAFSQRACHQIFGTKIAPLPCMSFEDVFEAIAKKKAAVGVIPVENTLAGSIHQNFDLLARYPFEAIAETLVRIEHSLIVHPGASLEKITQIFSHPVALAQCQKILRRLKKVEKVSFYDTAGSVQYIRDNGLRQAAAIASSDAARMYGMKILRRGIEDNRENFTRFLALAPRGRFSSQGRKTTIIFGLKNEPGALFKSLSVFALRNIDLTKIESRPIHGKPWEYLFYLDLQSDVRSRECTNALRHLREMTLYFKILGCYPTF